MNQNLITEYQNDYQTATIYNQDVPEVNTNCKIIRTNVLRYEFVSNATKVPSVIIGAIHMRESNFDFNSHLYNGDPLSGRTTHVPAGQPESPPINGSTYTWEESAIGAINLNLQSWSIDPNQEWGIAQALYFCETYNGMGYRKLGIKSPYLWSFTDKYESGLFVNDGKFNPSAISRQCGVVPIFKTLGLNLS